MSNLRHPNIVRFLGACLEPLQMSILFELCATSLYEVLHMRKQHLAMEYALSAIQQIGLGIFYLHQVRARVKVGSYLPHISPTSPSYLPSARCPCCTSTSSRPTCCSTSTASPR